MRSLNPNVSVDCVVFGYESGQLKVLLIQRDASRENDRSALSWTLPGDLIQNNENLDQAADRVLKELTSLDQVYLRQFGAFGDPNRVKNPSDKVWLEKMRAFPEARVITVAYFALVNIHDFHPQPAYFAVDVQWHTIDHLPKLAFDHNYIFEEALKALRERVEHSPIVFELLPDKFTLSQVQELYEVILDTTFDKRNFRRKILAENILEPLREKQQGVSHKPARLYKLKDENH